MAEASRRKPFIVGLTGSIGMGKSETAKLFARLGIPVHDADAAVHALYEKGGAAVAPIEQAFSGDRAALTALLGGNPQAFRRLEAIVHPLVRESERSFLQAASERGDELVVLDIPLLLETGGDARVDTLVVVSSKPDIQRARVLARPGMTPEKLDAILARQLPDVDKRAKADFVIETEQGLAQAFQDVKRVVAALRERAKNR